MGAWQANKNALVKARLRDTDLSLALALKAWSDPAFTLAGALTLGFAGRPNTVGLRFETENYGALRHLDMPEQADDVDGDVAGGALPRERRLRPRVVQMAVPYEAGRDRIPMVEGRQ